MSLKPTTTVTHTFRVKGVSPEILTDVRVTYEQGGLTIIEKTEQEIAVNGDKMVVFLRPEDTAKLMPGVVNIQFKARTLGGDTFASDIFTARIGRTLNKEIFTWNA